MGKILSYIAFKNHFSLKVNYYKQHPIIIAINFHVKENSRWF